MQVSHSFAESSPVSTGERKERRRHRRLNLHCKVVLFSNGTQILETTTENVSIGGFYCWSPTPFPPGDVLDSILAVPVEGVEASNPYPVLKCRVVVVRCEPAPNSTQFGIGFRIDDYKVDQDLDGTTDSRGRI